jgi:hypothetical protein
MRDNKTCKTRDLEGRHTEGMVPGNLFYRQEREAAGRRGQEEV